MAGGQDLLAPIKQSDVAAAPFHIGKASGIVSAMLLSDMPLRNAVPPGNVHSDGTAYDLI